MAMGSHLNELLRERTALMDIVQRVIDWNTKYPSDRIYSEGAVRSIAAEMDAISEDAKAVMAGIAGVQRTEGEQRG